MNSIYAVPQFSYPNRTLAGLAKVSVGAVNMVLNGLITKGFLYKSEERGYKFGFKDSLIANWFLLTGKAKARPAFGQLQVQRKKWVT